ncbi:MAG: nucleotide exchange factor GrpE [Methyloversatilis sp.]|jgi:molecular chaperone GrpE|nr:nucleotide exchange factor GrpE [Methyloversatilis sp.]MBP6194954.1 nucleotide exchange factor GrpE [Methyloversatilis sp.]MBP9118846.1 nucleotide exchange factor GrpE [Methyloversatilis sp.]
MTEHTQPADAGDSPTAGSADENLPADPAGALAAAEQKAAEHYESLLRSRAETENMRRRAAEDVLKAGKFGAEKFANAMLPVKDSLEAALAAEATDIAALRSGVELTLRQLQQAFSSASIEELNPLGEKFDPHRHQAISQIEAPGEPNHVVQVLQKGYLLHERVLRPALVIVSKAAG